MRAVANGEVTGGLLGNWVSMADSIILRKGKEYGLTKKMNVVGIDVWCVSE